MLSAWRAMAPLVAAVVIGTSAALLPAPVSALERSQGRIRLTLHERTGRFSVDYLAAAQTTGTAASRRQQYVPFLVTEDPRTSVLMIAIGNRVFRMGESALFATELITDADAPGFVWRSQQLEVRQTFRFVSSVLTRPADGVQVTLTLRNVSESDLEVGARYIFDTLRGEQTGTHFTLADGSEVTRERTLLGSSIGRSWVSGPRDEAQASLQMMTGGESITRPDRVVFANWKRLSDAAWLYETSNNRNFNLLPFSINDSAVSHYYGPTLLRSGRERTVTLVMGQYRAQGLTAIAADSGESQQFSEQLRQAMAESRAVESLDVTIETDLAAVSSVIAQLDRYLQSSTTPSAEELETIREVLDQLQERVGTPGQGS